MSADIQPFVKFIAERERIRIKKESGAPWPWTDDPVLRAYRFCNVRREDDKESRLIYRNWIAPHAEYPDLWFAMAVARLFNWWPTLEAIGWPAPWGVKRKTVEIELAKLQETGAKLFTGAYMVRADPHVSGSKALYLCDRVLQPLWDDRAHIRPRAGDTLASFHARLLDYKDMGPFIAGQIVADTKRGAGPLAVASDNFTWATPGPGSLRGLGRILKGNAPGDYHNFVRHGNWAVAFADVQEQYGRAAERNSALPILDGQNIQNCLCEFDKSERVRLGQGKPRSRYTYQPT